MSSAVVASSSSCGTGSILIRTLRIARENYGSNLIQRLELTVPPCPFLLLLLSPCALFRRRRCRRRLNRIPGRRLLYATNTIGPTLNS